MVGRNGSGQFHKETTHLWGYLDLTVGQGDDRDLALEWSKEKGKGKLGVCCSVLQGVDRKGTSLQIKAE